MVCLRLTMPGRRREAQPDLICFIALLVLFPVPIFCPVNLTIWKPRPIALYIAVRYIAQCQIPSNGDVEPVSLQEIANLSDL